MEIAFLILIVIISFLYSSVGHGGASGYLALMALFSIEPSLMKSSALVLNLFVSSIAFIAFYKGDRNEIVTMVVLTTVGGIAGSFAGSFKFQHVKLKFILATVLLIASIKLLMI